MFPPRTQYTPYPDPIVAPEHEPSSSSQYAASSSQGPTRPTRLNREQREKLLSTIKNQTDQCIVPIATGNPNLLLALEHFRENPQFLKMIRRTTNAMTHLLTFSAQELSLKHSTSLENAFGSMLNKMKVPKNHNPWFHKQNPFDQTNPMPYSSEEMLHAYQNSCQNIQMISELIKAALSDQLDISHTQARREIAPLLQELPQMITVCGAGSLMNLEDILKNLQNQLLPGDLSEQFDKQVEHVFEAQIQVLLKEVFKADPYYDINEIHRVKAIRFIATQLNALPPISIENDPYAKIFVQEIPNIEYSHIYTRITTYLLNDIPENIRADVICTQIASNYLDKIKSYITSNGIDIHQIPCNSTIVSKAIETLAPEFGSPPENYLHEEVERSSYTRCITNSPCLLACWFLYQLKGHNTNIQSAFEKLRIHHTKEKITKQSAPHKEYERVYQIGEIMWAQTQDPSLGYAEQIKIEHLSEEWLLDQKTSENIDPERINIFFQALINTSNQIIHSDPDSEDKNIKITIEKLLKTREFKSLGFEIFGKLPYRLTTSDEKTSALLFAHLASQKNQEKNKLVRFLFKTESLPSYLTNQKHIMNMVMNMAIQRLNLYPDLICEENTIIKKLVHTIFHNRAHRSNEMLQHKNLLSWSIKNNNPNLTDLIIQEYHACQPAHAVQELLNDLFPVTLTPKQSKVLFFYQWPANLALKTSALGIACINNSLGLVKVLLKEKQDLNKADQYGYAPLSYAAAYGSKELVEYLIANGANPSGYSPPEKSSHAHPILAAALAERTDLIDILVKSGADINQRSTLNHMTALHAAYITGNLNLIKKLYENGAEHNNKATLFNSKNLRAKRTPIEMIVHRIKNRRNDENKINRDSKGLERTQVYVFHQIHHHIPFNNAIMMHGYPLLHALAYQKNVKALEMVMESLSNQPEKKMELLNAQSSKGTHKKTPLMVAAKQGALEVVKLLLNQPETDVHLTDSKGRTALKIAMENHREDVINLLYPHSRARQVPQRKTNTRLAAGPSNNNRHLHPWMGRN